MRVYHFFFLLFLVVSFTMLLPKKVSCMFYDSAHAIKTFWFSFFILNLKLDRAKYTTFDMTFLIKLITNKCIYAVFRIDLFYHFIEFIFPEINWIDLIWLWLFCLTNLFLSVSRQQVLSIKCWNFNMIKLFCLNMLNFLLNFVRLLRINNRIYMATLNCVMAIINKNFHFIHF